MDSYVAAGWIVTAVVLVGYSWRTVRRGKVLSRSLPKDDKTWS